MSRLDTVLTRATPHTDPTEVIRGTKITDCGMAKKLVISEMYLKVRMIKSPFCRWHLHLRRARATSGRHRVMVGVISRCTKPLMKLDLPLVFLLLVLYHG